MSAGKFIASLVFVAAAAAACSDKTPVQPSCSYTVSSETRAFTAYGGTGAVTVATASGCGWTAASDASWIAMPGGTSGTGPGTLAFVVGASNVTDTRKATLTVAGQALAISQEGRAPCDYVVTPPSLDLAASGGTASLDVLVSGLGCAWTATTSAVWVTASPSSGTASGIITVTVSANTAQDQRETTVTVGGKGIAVRQAGAAEPPQPVCDYSVSPVDSVVHWHDASLAIAISTKAGCRWTAAPSAGWLSLDRSSGSGPAVVTASFPQFLEDGTRRAAVQVRWPTPTAGQNAWVTQEGCRYGVDPAASFPAAGGTRMVTVVTQAISASCSIGCPWTATSNVPWIQVTSSMPRAGDDAFSYRVDANPGSLRTGTISVAGRLHTVTQAGS